jgi:hypothetical protein
VETDIGPYLGRAGTTAGMGCPANGANSTNFAASYNINAVSTAPGCKVLTTHTLQ